MAKRKSKKTSNVLGTIILVIIVLLLLGALGVLAASYATSDTIDIKVNGVIQEQDSVIVLENGKNVITFDYTLKGQMESEKIKAVRILANATEDNAFVFNVDGLPMSYLGESDYTEYIATGEDITSELSLELTSDFNMSDFLSLKYSDGAVVVPEGIDVADSYIRLEIETDSDIYSYIIDINYRATNIVLEHTEVIL